MDNNSLEFTAMVTGKSFAYETFKGILTEQEYWDFIHSVRYIAIGWAWAKAGVLLDAGGDPRQYDQARLIDDASRDLDKEVQ